MGTPVWKKDGHMGTYSAQNNQRPWSALIYRSARGFLEPLLNFSDVHDAV